MNESCRLFGRTFSFAVCAAAFAAARLPGQINIYRYVLSVDVPESPGLVALALSPTQVLRASSPKPIRLESGFAAFADGASLSSLAIDVAPYFALGGGTRTLESYSSMSVAGRLARV